MKSYIFALLLLAAGLASSAAQAFSWSNCPSNEKVKIQSLSLSPSSAEFGQPLTALGRLELDLSNVSFVAPLSVTIEHRVNGRLLPCLGPLQGSCTIENLCTALQETAFDSCDPIGNLDCDCPFAMGTYAYGPTSPLEVTLTDDGERFLGQNEYSIRAYFPNTGPAVLQGCVDIEFEVVRCEDPPCVPGEPCEPKYCLQ